MLLQFSIFVFAKLALKKIHLYQESDLIHGIILLITTRQMNDAREQVLLVYFLNKV